MEARQPGEQLWAHAERFTKYATELPLAHIEVDGDGAYVGARQPVGGVESELRASAAPICDGEALGDGAVQDCSRGDRIARVGEPIEKPPRREGAPQILERDDAP